MKHEAKAQIAFGKYLREKRPYGYYELKHTDKEYLPLSKIEVHQYESLLAAEETGLVWKLSDQDQRIKPFDSFCSPPMPAYVVISFVKTFYFIRICDLLDMRDAGEFSITREKAHELAEQIVNY